jgi:outer membrane protein insertion porin family
LNLNSELRFPLLYGIGGSVFVDGGGVYLQDRPVTFDDFRRSAGLGVRYVTPVGPLSLEYGFKLDRRTGESVGEVHFSIGNIF